MENKIGEMISRARQNQGMTQKELASRLGVTSQAVSRWERGGGNQDRLRESKEESACGTDRYASSYFANPRQAGAAGLCSAHLII